MASRLFVWDRPTLEVLMRPTPFDLRKAQKIMVF